MTRLSKTQYDLRVFAASSVYVALVIALLPHARHAGDSTLRPIYALVPVLPLLYIVWLLGRRIWQSDELEQRTHLIGLGVASAIVGVFSLIGGFLAVTKAVPQDTAPMLLIWVFPIMLFSYGFVQWWTARHYGGGCDDIDGLPAHYRFIGLALLFGIVALWAWLGKADASAVVFAGFAGAFALTALVFALRRRRRIGSGEE